MARKHIDIAKWEREFYWDNFDCPVDSLTFQLEMRIEGEMQIVEGVMADLYTSAYFQSARAKEQAYGDATTE